MIEYATDTYQFFNYNANQVFTQFAKSGRFLTGIIGWLLKKITISELAIYYGSTILSIMFAIISIYKLYKIVNEDISNKFLKAILSTLIVLNPFSIELFLFIEKGMMMFAVLMSIYGVEKLIKYLKTKKKEYIVISIIFMFVANCCYQGVVGIFAGIGLIYIVKYSRNIKEFIINNSIIAMIYGLPAILDLLIIKLTYSTSRINGKIDLSKSLQKIIPDAVKMIRETYKLLPEFMLIALIVFTFLVLCYKIVKEKGKHKFFAVFMEILKYTYLLMRSYIYNCIATIFSTNRKNMVSTKKYIFIWGDIWNNDIICMCK